MMMNTVINRLRDTALALGILAVVPMAAQAMLTKHDTLDIGTIPAFDAVNGSSVVKQLSADADSALQVRFGTYSGIPETGHRQFRVEPSAEPRARSTNGLSEPNRWLP